MYFIVSNLMLDSGIQINHMDKSTKMKSRRYKNIKIIHN